VHINSATLPSKTSAPVRNQKQRGSRLPDHSPAATPAQRHRQRLATCSQFETQTGRFVPASSFVFGLNFQPSALSSFPASQPYLVFIRLPSVFLRSFYPQQQFAMSRKGFVTNTRLNSLHVHSARNKFAVLFLRKGEGRKSRRNNPRNTPPGFQRRDPTNQSASGITTGSVLEETRQ
jgi:hypothetical protein